jgi:GT2 family glycosyltransferase
MKTLVAVCTFGGLQFTKITVDEIFKTATKPIEVAIVVGDPNDRATEEYGREQYATRGVHLLVHMENKGFSGTINDVYDFAWHNGFEAVIFCGNDCVVMPKCIDSMIEVGETTDWEVICASMFTPESLCNSYPEARKFFRGPNYLVDDFTARPWEMQDLSANGIQVDCMKDVRNFTMFKKSSFDKVGYADANFWPNAYFEDNCTCLRMQLAGVKCCGVRHAIFFHWVSRTIHQGEKRPHGRYFDRNSQFYKEKWGGPVGQEKWTLPFNGRVYRLPNGVVLPPTLKIDSRADEAKIVDYWRKL